jgi:hypothetical protein
MLQASEFNHHLIRVHFGLLRRELLPLPLAEPVDDYVSGKADYFVPLLLPDDQRSRILVAQFPEFSGVKSVFGLLVNSPSRPRQIDARSHA